MKQIDSVQNFGSGYLANGINDGGAKAQISLSEVRGAIAWPSAGAPGYYLFLGKVAVPSPLGRSPLLFLGEGQDHFNTELFRKCTDDALRMKSNTIYADRGTIQGRGWQGFYTEFWDYASSRNLSIDITPAPSVNDAKYGVVLIQEYLKSDLLLLPRTVNTTILTQLKNMDPDFKPEEEPYAHKAMRFAIAGFVKFDGPSINPMFIRKTEPLHPNAWT